MDKTDKKEIADGGEQSLESLVRMVCVVKDRKFVPYGTTAIIGGKPVYFFDTYADYEAAAPMLPEECMFVTLDDVDTGGFEFDSELSETSENAVQNKIITAALRKKASFDSPGVVQFTDSQAVTDRDSGLALRAGENNAGIEGTLANRIENVLEKTNRLAEAINLSVRIEKTVYIDSRTETTFTLGSGKTYILVLNNAYNVYFLYIASTGRNAASGHIHQLIPSGFFEPSVLGKAEFKIKSGEANGWMYAICIAGF